MCWTGTISGSPRKSTSGEAASIISNMPRETYAAARTVSPKVEAYFARRRAEAVSHSQEHLASLPDAVTIEAVIDVAFWASLRREEGYMPRISLAFLSPDQTTHPLLFERLLPLDPAVLTRVGPAVESALAFIWVSGMTQAD